VRAQLEELVTSYEAIENSLEETAHQQGVEDTVNQAVQQAPETVQRAAQQALDVAGEATEQAQSVERQVRDQARQATDQAQGAVGHATEIAEEVETNATKAATQKAEKLGVDLSTVTGSGPGGLITLKDLMAATQRG